MRQIKKTTFIIVFISAIFVSASFMVAKAYEPLVRLPGLPLTGDINLSQYVVGLYNFLLSIVGIVAVMMLIIGGMKYITAAGNASIIGDAKDTISNAIFGLLLALLSWVIVSTINPDVLYIKNPASNLGSVYENNFACGIYDPADSSCVCKDGSLPAVANEAECDAACADPISCELEKSFPCIGGGLTGNNPVDGKCSCVDGESEVEVNYGPAPKAPDDAKCNEVCSNPDWAADGEYHGINWRLKVGHDVNRTMIIPEGENFTVEAGKLAYYDFSEVRDCKDNLVHFFIGFNGEPAGWVEAFVDPHRWCCINASANCLNTWGECCNLSGTCVVASVIPTCSTLSDMNPIDGYPIFKHTYDTAGKKETVWVGISVSTGGTNCEETEKFFYIDVQ